MGSRFWFRVETGHFCRSFEDGGIEGDLDFEMTVIAKALSSGRREEDSFL